MKKEERNEAKQSRLTYVEHRVRGASDDFHSVPRGQKWSFFSTSSINKRFELVLWAEADLHLNCTCATHTSSASQKGKEVWTGK